MALTRITSNVIKDQTIGEAKFQNTYLDSNAEDTALQPITFENNVTIKSGTGGNSYFSANAQSGAVTFRGNDRDANVINVSVGSISLSNGDVQLLEAGAKVQTPKIELLSNGTVTTPSIYFQDSPNNTTGIWRFGDSNTEQLNFSISGSLGLSLSQSEIRFGSTSLKIKSGADSYSEYANYDTNANILNLGGTTSKLDFKVNNQGVLYIRSVDSNGNALSSPRVGINQANPQATLDVAGSIKATGYQGISTSDLPTIPVTKGGTGLTQFGLPEQLIRMNAAGNAYEYFTLNTGDVNNLSGFGVSGDGNVYTINTFDTAGTAVGQTGLLRLQVEAPNSNLSAAWKVGQKIKIFGINTTNIDQYDVNGGVNNIFNTWANAIQTSATRVISPNGAAGGNVRYTYFAALFNNKTGVVSSITRLKHIGGVDYVENQALGAFNDSIYNSLPLQRPTNDKHSLLLYRRVIANGNSLPVVFDRDGNAIDDHYEKLNLIAIIGQRDIGGNSQQFWNYQDYGPFNRTTWGDFNTDGSYNQKYQLIKNVPCSIDFVNFDDRRAIPGFSLRTVLDVLDFASAPPSEGITPQANNQKLVISNQPSVATGEVIIDSTSISTLNTLTPINNIQICHDDTSTLQAAIQTQINKGLRSLFLIGGTYLVTRLVIPSSFSLVGSGKATVIQKVPFDTSYELVPGNTEYNRNYAALWLREPVDILGQESNNQSQPVKNVTIRDLVIDGNQNSSIRLGIPNAPEGNALIYCEGVENANIASVDIQKSVGDGIYAAESNRLSIQNTSVIDNSITYLTFDNPLNATDSTVLKVSDSAFLSSPGPVDITTSEVVAFNSCIIRNCGTGLRIFGVRSSNTENNLILGPDDEWIPTTDLYDSDFNSINIKCDKTTGTGSGDVFLTYVEENVAKNLANVVLDTSVYKIKVDTNGNEIIDGGPLEYRLNGAGELISVLETTIVDEENGVIKLLIPSAIEPSGSYDINGTGKAVHSIPYRRILNSGEINTNYNFLGYVVVGAESIAVGEPDNNSIEGVVGYDASTQTYTISIGNEFLTNLNTGDLVTLREHNTQYSLPANLTVFAIRFEVSVNKFVLDLRYFPETGESFNEYNTRVNSGNGWTSPNGPLATEATAKGYIEKRRSFTIAKGIIGVV